MSDLIDRQAAIDAVMEFMPSLTTPDGTGEFDAEIFAAQEMFVDIGQALSNLPSAQPDLQQSCNQLATDCNTHNTLDALDCISRQAAIDAIEQMQMPIMRSPFTEEQFVFSGMSEALHAIKDLPSAQPERLTDDDFETIRIHLNAYKEKLCNQQRWEEADEYQRIIDRFMAFASAQPDIIACGDCKHWINHDRRCGFWNHGVRIIDWCSRAERREDGI